jgi:hypothetical protein
MSVRLCNAWLDALVNALRAEENHEAALAALVASFGGKRSLPLMEALQSGFRVIYPSTLGEVKMWGGALTLTFPRGSAAAQCWQRKILPHLPKLRQRTGNAKKIDPVATFARRAQREFSAAQIRRLIALLGE